MEVVGAEGGAVAAAAVEDQLGVFVGDELFDVAFDDAASHVACALSVALLPFVVFAYVDELGGFIGGEASEGFLDGDFADACFGVLDELEEACGVFHVGCPFVYVCGGCLVMRMVTLKKSVGCVASGLV